jgi:hypothetical protein
MEMSPAVANPLLVVADRPTKIARQPLSKDTLAAQTIET